MIGLGTYWRSALLLPVLAPVILIVVFGGLLNLVFASDDPVMRPMSVGEMFKELFVDGTRSGVWPAYALWCAGFLLSTRRFTAERIRRVLWWAPLTFAPLAAVFWVASEIARGRSRELSAYAIGIVAYLVVSTAAGYIAVAFAHVF